MAFKSTLEEAKNADLILNVCDASSDECAEHLSVTSSVLKELGADNIPVISVMNKCDKLQNAIRYAGNRQNRYDKCS